MAAKVIQVVKPHIPMIAFPARGVPKPAVPASESIKSQNLQPLPQPAISSNAPLSKAAERRKKSLSESKPIGYIPRGSGIDPSLLPNKYKRKPMQTEEIEYILRGGPE